VLIAFVVGGQACAHLGEEKHPKDDTALIVLAVLSVFAFTILGVLKWFISVKLDSPTMKKDAICSLAVGVLSLAVCISSSAYEANKAVWWFDAVVAVLTCLFLLGYGSRTLFCHNHKWWQRSWWSDDAAAVAQHHADYTGGTSTAAAEVEPYVCGHGNLDQSHLEDVIQKIEQLQEAEAAAAGIPAGVDNNACGACASNDVRE